RSPHRPSGRSQRPPKGTGSPGGSLAYAGAVPELRNVIVFSIGARGASTGRYALELRWVREVVSLGFITNVPTAPPAVSGVCNLHGTILPVLDVGGLLGDELG